MLYRSLQGVSRKQKATLVAGRVKRSLKQRSAQIRRRVRIGKTGLVFRALGPGAGVKFFWRSPKTWADVEPRLIWLARHHPDHVADFVAGAVQKTTDAMTLLGLARSSISDQHLRPLIALVEGAPPDALAERLQRSQILSAAYVGALMLLDGPEAAQIAQDHAYRWHQLPRTNYERFLDSISFCPARDGQTRSFISGFTRPTGHRLLIVDGAQDRRRYTHLMRDSRKVTVIDMSDFYGKARFDDIAERGVDEILVEHLRSRLTRFCPDYHQLHDETKAAAQQITAHIAACEGAGESLFGTATHHIELELADQIFFSALKLRAVQKLLQDPEIDHIVIAHHNAPNRPYDRVLSCLPELAQDSRVEFVSIAQGLKQRFQARAAITAATHAYRLSDRALPPTGLTLITADLERKIAKRIEQLDLPEPETKKRLLVLTSHNTAYNPSTAKSITALRRDYAVDAVFSGSSLQHFLADEASATALESLNHLSVAAPLLGNSSDLRYWLVTHMQTAAQELATPDIAAIVLALADLITANSLLPATVDYAFMKARMAQLAKADRLPDLCLLTPQRNPRLGAMSEAARGFGVPTLALEPHGLNGNYCRYSKVAMDYYGVISQYFLDTCDSDFGIAQNRSRIIGSPRIHPPEGYQPETAKAAARAELHQGQGIAFDQGQTYIAFFCQPSAWAHVSKVWANVLEATAALNVTLLLKTHPEESEARIARYLDIARDAQAEARVAVVTGAPNTILAASDIVLTGYSAAAIDAAVMEKPILCVTADGQRYPIDQHKIVHSTLCDGAPALEAELRALLASPEECQRRASAFLRAEPQFVAGSDQLLREFVADILATSPAEALRPEAERPQSLFLDGPFTPFKV